MRGVRTVDGDQLRRHRSKCSAHDCPQMSWQSCGGCTLSRCWLTRTNSVDVTQTEWSSRQEPHFQDKMLCCLHKKHQELCFCLPEWSHNWSSSKSSMRRNLICCSLWHEKDNLTTLTPINFYLHFKMNLLFGYISFYDQVSKCSFYCAMQINYELISLREQPWLSSNKDCFQNDWRSSRTKSARGTFAALQQTTACKVSV